MTTESIVAELAKIGFANMGDYLAEDDEGNVVVDITGMTADEAAVLSEVRTETYMKGRGDAAVPVTKVYIKKYDKKAALDSLARVKGMFNDSIEVTGEMSLVERLNRGRLRASKQKVEGEDEG